MLKRKETNSSSCDNMNIEEYNRLSKRAIEKGIADLDKTVFPKDGEEDSLQRV